MALSRTALRSTALLIVCVAALMGCIPVAEKTPATVPTTAQVGEIAEVVNIIDGDTIDVRIDGKTYRVRYIGINTPEREQQCYTESTAVNAALVRGQTVTLVKDVSNTDRYDRLLRYVFVGEVFVNAQLVAQGYAESRAYPPDTAHQAYFDQLAAQARTARLGCYPTGVFR